jgi:hypothetical protein
MGSRASQKPLWPSFRRRRFKPALFIFCATASTSSPTRIAKPRRRR